jgi:hypothetical protein
VPQCFAKAPAVGRSPRGCAPPRQTAAAHGVSYHGPKRNRRRAGRFPVTASWLPHTSSAERTANVSIAKEPERGIRWADRGRLRSQDHRRGHGSRFGAGRAAAQEAFSKSKERFLLCFHLLRLRLYNGAGAGLDASATPLLAAFLTHIAARDGRRPWIRGAGRLARGGVLEQYGEHGKQAQRRRRGLAPPAAAGGVRKAARCTRRGNDRAAAAAGDSNRLFRQVQPSPHWRLFPGQISSRRRPHGAMPLREVVAKKTGHRLVNRSCNNTPVGRQ